MTNFRIDSSTALGMTVVMLSASLGMTVVMPSASLGMTPQQFTPH